MSQKAELRLSAPYANIEGETFRPKDPETRFSNWLLYQRLTDAVVDTIEYEVTLNLNVIKADFVLEITNPAIITKATKAVPGIVKKTAGSLLVEFPELNRLSDDDIEEILRDSRRRVDSS